jgi:spore germination protein (amino acid permease)
MKENYLSSRQYAFMIYLLLTGSSLVFLTGSVASQDAWLCTVIGSFFGFYVLNVIHKIQDLFPGQRITQISTTVFGKIPGTLLNLLFFWSVFTILITFIFDIMMLLEIIYPFMPRVILYPLLVLPCCYCLYKGITVLGRLGEITIIISFFISLIGLVLALPLIDLTNLKPFFENWRPIVAGTLYSADWPFDEVITFALFLPMISDLKQNKAKIYYGYFGGALILALIDITIITLLGANQASLSVFPLFEASRVIGIENFQRVELLFFVIWFTTGLYAILVFFQGMNYIVQDLFVLKSNKILILPLGLCLIVFTLYMFPNTIEYQLLGFKYLEVFTFPTNLLYPTIILCAAKYRQKRQPQIPSKTNPLQDNAL